MTRPQKYHRVPRWLLRRVPPRRLRQMGQTAAAALAMGTVEHVLHLLTESRWAHSAVVAVLVGAWRYAQVRHS